MPASKQAHVLAVLRKNLSLKQPELAELVGCSASTIQQIELNRLSLSPGLAGRISAATGVDLDWLRANDLNRPFPPVRMLTIQNKRISQLIADFKSLFTDASSIPKGPERDTLSLYIAWELSRLKSGPPQLTAEEETELEKAEQAFETDEQARLDSQKASSSARKAPHRTPKSV
jgi:transcriptional regulator with XRE-family HTH domain